MVPAQRADRQYGGRAQLVTDDHAQLVVYPQATFTAKKRQQFIADDRPAPASERSNVGILAAGAHRTHDCLKVGAGGEQFVGELFLDGAGSDERLRQHDQGGIARVALGARRALGFDRVSVAGSGDRRDDCRAATACNPLVHTAQVAQLGFR